jgi:hypothetical protein
MLCLTRSQTNGARLPHTETSQTTRASKFSCFKLFLSDILSPQWNKTKNKATTPPQKNWLTQAASRAEVAVGAGGFYGQAPEPLLLVPAHCCFSLCHNWVHKKEHQVMAFRTIIHPEKDKVEVSFCHQCYGLWWRKWHFWGWWGRRFPSVHLLIVTDELFLSLLGHVFILFL